MPKIRKPFALAPGSTIAVVAPASSTKEERIQRGCETLAGLDFRVKRYPSTEKCMDFFSGPLAERRKQLQDALSRPEIAAVFCSRGGYGSTEILDGLNMARFKRPKVFCAFSDLTSVHIYLWQKLRWVTFYGPLVAGGFDAGPNATNGFDPDSFLWAMTATNSGWTIPLEGETFARGTAEGTLLGGCITLIETSIGTPWELDTRGSILLLEDRGVKPYFLDRMLLHLKQAGKFEGVRGIILGEFPDSETPEGGSVGVAEVCKRVLGPLKIPIVYGVAIGHTQRPMLTMPLGVRARLHAKGEGRIDILRTGGARMTKPLHFHLSGIGGAAMTPLAGMLVESGYRVTGSDAGVYPPASTLLQSLGIAWKNGFDAANLEPAPDLVVIGNALSRGNPEVEAVLDNKIPYRSLPQTLEEFFLPRHDSLVVTGTHGKTTTTSMLSWILHHAGRRPNFLIGGVAENFGRSFGLGGGNEFVLEGDEYDSAFFDKAPKFLHYHPQEMILTSLEFDHADIYDNLAAIELQFRRLVNLVPKSGRIVAWGESETVRGVLQKAYCPVETYGFMPGVDWLAGDLEIQDGETHFRISRGGKEVARIKMALAGRHNVLNATAAAAIAHGRGVSGEAIAAAMAEFRGVLRRLEIKGENSGVLVVDDFAHHPTAIRATIDAARHRWPGRKLWAVFEPRSNTMRRKVFEKDLAASLATADAAVLGAVNRANLLSDTERMSPARVLEAITAAGHSAEGFETAEEISEYLAEKTQPGDLVLVMSNGSFDGLCGKLLGKLQERGAPAGKFRA